MKIAHYESALDNEPAVLDIDWTELVELLTTFAEPLCAAPESKSLLVECAGKECKAKYGAAWSPVDIEGLRANANVKFVTAAVFDLDHVNNAEVERIDDALTAAGLAAILHSTHNNTPPEDLCLRLVLQLSRPVHPFEWPRVRQAIVEMYGLPADEATKDLSRIYFLPTHRDGVEPTYGSMDGVPIDVDALLAGSREPTISTSIDVPAEAVDLSALRKALQATYYSKAHGSEREREQGVVLRRVLHGEPLADTGARDATLLRAVGLVVYHLPAGVPWEAVLEIIRPSLSQMDVNPEGIDYWIEQAQIKFKRVSRARAAADARRAADDAAVRELAKSLSTKSVAKGIGVGEDWEKLLIADEKGLKICERNTQLLLANAPELKNTIRFNEVTKAIEVRGGPLAGVPAEVLDSAAAGWMQTHRDYFASASMIGRELAFVARQAAYDPLSEYLNELAWDGVSRVDTFLEKYFNAEPNNYTRIISKRWLISLVARALRPGCEVQTVLILEGAQGVGKTRALRALAGDFYLGTSVHLGDKDFLQLISGAWLVELGELASIRRAETEKVKQFLDQRSDKFRAPYGRTAEEWLRRCVFVGTTNESDYLTDRTGNRRYWPVRVGSRVDVDGILADRDQILAEAVSLFIAGEQWWLEDDEIPAAAAETEQRLESSPVEEAVARWWFTQERDKRPRTFTTLDVAEQALHTSVDRVDRALQTQIGRAITTCGFIKNRKRGAEGRLIYIYEPTEALLNAPVKTRGMASILGVVAGAKST
jgi:predicted P-loop ATPase